MIDRNSENLVGRVGDKDPEFEFRDGKRTPPAYLAPFIARIPDLHALTYEQAVLRVNDIMVSDHLNAAIKSAIGQHFGSSRG